MVERRQFPRQFDDESKPASRNGDASTLAEEPVEPNEAPADLPEELPESAIPNTVEEPPAEEELPPGLAAAVRDAETPPPTAEERRRIGDPPPAPDLDELPRRLEALLFVADHPVDEATLSLALAVERRQLRAALDRLGATLRDERRGTRLQQGPDGIQLVSDPDAAEYIEYFLGLEASRKLSNASLETLAIVAYRQPVTRGGIDAVRGVNSDGAVATLRARGLIHETGRAPTPGRPRLFGTTQRFLEHFGLERASDLPPLPEDVDLPPHEIGEQLGLDDTEVAALLAAEAAAEETPADAEAEITGEVDVLAETAAALADEAPGNAGEAEREPSTAG